MKRLPLLVCGLCTCTALAADPSGRMPAAKTREVKSAMERLLEACVEGNTGTMATARAEVLDLLGPYAGRPEREQTRVEPIDISPPDRTLVTAGWRRTLSEMEGKFPW